MLCGPLGALTTDTQQYDAGSSAVAQTPRIYSQIDLSFELNMFAAFQRIMFLKFCALTPRGFPIIRHCPLEQLGVKCLAQGHLDGGG